MLSCPLPTSNVFQSLTPLCFCHRFRCGSAGSCFRSADSSRPSLRRYQQHKATSTRFCNRYRNSLTRDCSNLKIKRSSHLRPPSRHSANAVTNTRLLSIPKISRLSPHARLCLSQLPVQPILGQRNVKKARPAIYRSMGPNRERWRWTKGLP